MVHERMLTIAEVADLLGLSEKTIRRYIRAGELTAARFSPSRVRIEPASVRQFVALRSKGGVRAKATTSTTT